MEINFGPLREELTSRIRKVRQCVIHDKPYASVYDVLKAFSDPKNPSTSWRTMKKNYPELARRVLDHPLEGVGASESSPVADTRTTMEIICHISGKTSEKWTAAAVEALLAMMSPDERLIAAMTDRLRDIERGISSDNDEGSMLVTRRRRNATVTLTERTVYVRACVPPDFQDTAASGQIVLNTDILKFGITASKNDRNNKYGADNGFFAFSFVCHEAYHAEDVERILRKDLSTCTVSNSFEYVSTVGVAQKMGVPYDGTYESYIAVARTLFVAFVQRIRLLWPDQYRGVYGMQSDLRTSSVDGAGTESACTAIDDGMAAIMGFDSVIAFGARTNGAAASGSTTAGSSPAAPTPSSSTSTASVEEEVVSQDTHPSTHKIICRDVHTGKETSYLDMTEAARQRGVSRITISRSFLDQPRVAHGIHYRTRGQKHWDPPTGFTYRLDALEKNIAGSKPLCSLDESGRVHRIYEAQSTAVALVDSLNRRVLRDHIDGKTSGLYLGMTWKNLSNDDEFGTWSGDHSERVNDNIFPVQTPPSKRIISHRLADGKEEVHESLDCAVEWLEENAVAISLTSKLENIIGCPNQIDGNVFRYQSATDRWQPDERYIFKMDTPCQMHVVCEDDAGSLVNLFESTLAAAAHESERLGETIERHTITNVLGKNKLVGGRRWRYATQEETHTFVSVASPSQADATSGELVRLATREESAARKADQGVIDTRKAPIKARNVITGEVRTFKSVHAASQALAQGMQSKNFATNFIDTARQAYSWTFSSHDKPIWIPPDNLVIVTGSIEKKSKGMVTGYDREGVLRTYESAAAALRLGGVTHPAHAEDCGGFWEGVSPLFRNGVTAV